MIDSNVINLLSNTHFAEVVRRRTRSKITCMPHLKATLVKALSGVVLVMSTVASARTTVSNVNFGRLPDGSPTSQLWDLRHADRTWLGSRRWVVIHRSGRSTTFL
jgi:hypothetical protein